MNMTRWITTIRERLQRPAPPPETRRIGLALSGGGGKGAAHIGVLQVIQELDIPIDLIVGTSAGGAVAVLYAAGFDLAAIQDVFRQSALRRIATPDHRHYRPAAAGGDAVSSPRCPHLCRS